MRACVVRVRVCVCVLSPNFEWGGNTHTQRESGKSNRETGKERRRRRETEGEEC